MMTIVWWTLGILHVLGAALVGLCAAHGVYLVEINHPIAKNRPWMHLVASVISAPFWPITFLLCLRVGRFRP